MSTSPINGTNDAVSTTGATDAAPVEVLPPLADIWKCSKISQCTYCNGKKEWSCAWCPPGSTHFTGWNVKGFNHAKASFPQTMHVFTRITLRIKSL
jgi:hypothetical protein